MAAKPKFTPEERNQILQLLAQGVSVAEVARQFNVDPRRVGGLLSTARNTGTMPGAADSANGWYAVPTDTFHAASTPTQAPVESTPPATEESYPSATSRYGIERIDPGDGYLGTLHRWLDDDEFGWRFGSGTYQISVSEGSFPIRVIIRIVDESHGPARFPAAFPDWEADGWRPLPEEWS